MMSKGALEQGALKMRLSEELEGRERVQVTGINYLLEWLDGIRSSTGTRMVEGLEDQSHRITGDEKKE